MKKLLLIAFLSTACVLGYGQNETLFGKVNHVSGFGGPMIEISQIAGQTVADVGGGGALILDNFFFGGYGLGTSAPNITISQEVFDVEFNHGGLWFGYTTNPNKLAHLYSSFRLGWGETNLLDGEGDKRFSDNVLVLAPELGVELNLTSWFKIALSGGYRYVDGVDSLPETSALDNDSFRSAFGTITFRFGGFSDWDNWDDDDDDKNGFDADFNF